MSTEEIHPPAGLDQVLGAVGDDEAAVGRVDRDIAGHEPAVVGESVGALAAEAGIGDPRAAHQQPAHRLPVPRDGPAPLVADLHLGAG
jgi:hypothetical protein